MKLTMILIALAALTLGGTQLSAQRAERPKPGPEREARENQPRQRAAPAERRQRAEGRQFLERHRGEIERRRGMQRSQRGEARPERRERADEGKRAIPGPRRGMMPRKQARPQDRRQFNPGKRLLPKRKAMRECRQRHRR